MIVGITTDMYIKSQELNTERTAMEMGLIQKIENGEKVWTTP